MSDLDLWDLLDRLDLVSPLGRASGATMTRVRGIRRINPVPKVRHTLGSRGSPACTAFQAKYIRRFGDVMDLIYIVYWVLGSIA